MEQDRLDDILATFEALEEWEDRYRYIIDLGKSLEPLDDAARNDANKVQGCASQVWLETTKRGDLIHFAGDSDALIVKGLVALMIALHSDKTPNEIIATDAAGFMSKIGLSSHLSPQRSNGLKSMVARMRKDAVEAMAKEGSAR